MKKIYFRADASADIGYGHFVRSLALADMLKDDFECVFVTQSPTEYQRLEVAKVCQLVEVPATDEKFAMFLEMLQGDEIVVLDNYFYDTGYQRAIKEKGCKLVCIDDMHDKHYVADVVINHALNNPCLFNIETYTKLCIGIQWALLRKPFLDISKKSSSTLNNIVISVGGADPYNLNASIVESIKGKMEYDKLFVIAGVASKIETHADVEVYRNLSALEIANLFKRARIGIFSSSTICIEALASGLTVFSGYYVDNQKGFYQYLLDSHYAFGLGDLLKTPLIFPKKMDFVSRFDPSIIRGVTGRYIHLFKEL